jgi:MFS family permease
VNELASKLYREGPSASMAEHHEILQAATPAPAAAESAWAPFREPLFRTLWIASVTSYVGTWMQNMGTGWLMASLTASPMLVGLVQAATTLPVFLVILPAGALADLVDRRRFLLLSQAWMVLAAAALGLLTIFGMVSPWSLVLLTFLLGFGAVMNDPAWQAITPEIVSARRMPSAIALNSAGYNAARAAGPALGGLVIALAGSGFAFLLNAASFFGVIIFLYRWRRVPHQVPDPTQRLHDALAAGFRYARSAANVRAVLVRTGVFSIFASVIWALPPLVARPHGPVGYGLLLGFFGLGALAGAVLLPGLRRAFSYDALVLLSTIVFAAVTLGVAELAAFGWMCLLLFAGGISWIAIIATLNVSAQTMCPAWIRARALSMYLLVLQGGMAAGSAVWGAVASRLGLPAAFVIAALGMILGLLAALRYPLPAYEWETAHPSLADSPR